MNRQEHLMVKAMEECNEIAHRISKACRFGLDQIQQDPDDKPEQNPGRQTNRARIVEEVLDLVVMLSMLGIHIPPNEISIPTSRILRVERYLKIARQAGTLTE
jgi:hypothetical protein